MDENTSPDTPLPAMIPEEHQREHLKAGVLVKYVMGALEKNRKHGITMLLLMKRGVAVGSTSNSVKQCLYRLQKQGKIIRVKNRWFLTPAVQKEPAKKAAPKKTVQRTPVKPAGLTPDFHLTAVEESKVEKELALAESLAILFTLTPDERARIVYLASLLSVGKIKPVR